MPVGGNVRDVRFGDTYNQPVPIYVTLLGMVSVWRPHTANANSPIYSRLEPNCMDVSAVHDANALAYIEVTVFGITIDVSDVHPEKALFPTDSVFAPSVTDVRLVQPLNELAGMFVTLFGMTTDSIVVLPVNRVDDIPDIPEGSVTAAGRVPRYPTATPEVSNINPVSCVPNIRNTSESLQNAEGSPTSLVVSVIAHPPNA